MGTRQKNRAREEAFSKRYDSTMGRHVRTKREGKPIMGSATKNDVFIASLSGGSGERFRDRPEIARMRERGEAGKRRMQTHRETPEELARRLKKKRGGY